MVDLRINVVRTTCKDNAFLAGFLQILKNLFTLLLNIASRSILLIPRFLCSSENVLLRNIKFLLEFFYKLVCQDLLGSERHERIHELDVVLLQFFHVVLDVLCIGSYHRAVVMVACTGHFFTLVRNTRIENERNPFLDQPGNMSVG